MSTGYINLPVQGGGGGGTWDSLTGSLTTTASFWSQMPEFPEYLNYFVKEYDFFPNVITNYAGDLLVGVSGAGAAYQISDYAVSQAGINSTEKALGVIFLNTGTTTTGYAYTGFGSNNVATFLFGNHDIRFGTRANISHLSDGTETFTAVHGFMNTITASPTYGAFFRYTHGTNGGRWEYCMANGSIVAADTGVAPSAAVYQVLEIVANRAGTEVKYYIDGALVGTVTSGFPTQGFFPGIRVVKSAGSTARGIYVDALYLATERLATR